MGSDYIDVPDRQEHFISIHAPAWGATFAGITGVRVVQFQSTLPHGERQKFHGYTVVDLRDFNPRSRMGSDRRIHLMREAPTAFQSTLPHGERRMERELRKPCISISIHAPAWGATLFFFDTQTCFKISIHAPAWGATNIIYSVATVIADFNPRSRMGSDKHNIFCGYSDSGFQSTLPHGERPPPLDLLVVCHPISIHAPAWGATRPGRHR